MAEIKLNKRYKYAGDIFQKLISIGFDIETATAFLNEVEDADVVEVVRCKDCKNLTVHNSPTLYAYCEKTHFRLEPFQTDTRTHFCGFGERRTDDGNL